MSRTQHKAVAVIVEFHQGSVNVVDLVMAVYEGITEEKDAYTDDKEDGVMMIGARLLAKEM